MGTLDAVIGNVRLGPEAASARAARQFVADRLLDATGSRATEDMVLLTSEVVTNAILHAGTSVDVMIRGMGAGVQIEVTDGTREIPGVVDGPLGTESGLGLRIVAELSEDWGVMPVEGGKTVWFRCPLPPA